MKQNIKAESNDFRYNAAVMPSPVAAQHYCVIVRSPCVFTRARCYLLPPPPTPTRHTHTVAYIFFHPLTHLLSTKLQRKWLSLLLHKKNKQKKPSIHPDLVTLQRTCFEVILSFSERAFMFDLTA